MLLPPLSENRLYRARAGGPLKGCEQVSRPAGRPRFADRLGTYGDLCRSWYDPLETSVHARLLGELHQRTDEVAETLPLLYGCGSEFNRNHYCNHEVETLIGQQSSETDQGEAQAAGVADRAEAGRGWRPTGHPLQSRWDLPASVGEGADPYGQ